MYWPERYLCEECAFQAGDYECPRCGNARQGPKADPHVCPEPYPYEIAKAMVSMGTARSPLIVSPRQKARIVLGLRQPHCGG
jgi:hypothetical protein